MRMGLLVFLLLGLISNAFAGYNVTFFETHFHDKRLFKLVIKNLYGPLTVISTHREVHISEQATRIVEEGLLKPIEQWVLAQEVKRGTLVPGSPTAATLFGRENIRQGRSSVVALMETPDLSSLQFVVRADRRGVAKLALGVEESEEIVLLPPQEAMGSAQRHIEGMIQLMNFAKADMTPPDIITLGLLEAEATGLLTRGRDILRPGIPRPADFWILMGFIGNGVYDAMPPTEYILKCHEKLEKVHARRGFVRLPPERFYITNTEVPRGAYGLKGNEDILMSLTRENAIRVLKHLDRSPVGRGRLATRSEFESVARRCQYDAIASPNGPQATKRSMLDPAADACIALIATHCFPALEFISIEKYYGFLIDSHFRNGGTGLLPTGAVH